MNKEIKREAFRKIRKSLKKKLTKTRYEHTLGVEYTSASLAMCYGMDLLKAELAGLLHDCAKQEALTGKDMLELCRKYNISVTPVEEADPYLLHGKLGAYFCEHEYGITDEEILSSIRFHTTGRPGMTLLEKIIYVADYIEPQRDKAPRLDKLRRLAFFDLDEAVYQITKDTLEYLENGTGRQNIDDTTRKTYEYYKEIHENKRKE